MKYEVWMTQGQGAVHIASFVSETDALCFVAAKEQFKDGSYGVREIDDQTS